MSTNRDVDSVPDGTASTTEFWWTVVTSIAIETDTDLTALPPIYHSIDPDVLNGFRDGDETKTLSFGYTGYEVTVRGDGEIELRPLA